MRPNRQPLAALDYSRVFAAAYRAATARERSTSILFHGFSGSGRRGSTLIEAALFIPILLLLIVGMVQIGKISYLYYTLKKTLYTAARYVATQQNVNLCDAADATVAAAKTYALTGTTDGTADSFLPTLTADMLQISVERYDSDSQQLNDACDGSSGAAPDFVVVSIPGGFEVRPRIPFIVLDPILLRPQVKIPFNGTLTVGGTS